MVLAGALLLAAVLPAPAVLCVGELFWLGLPVPGRRTVVRKSCTMSWPYRALWGVFLAVGIVSCWAEAYHKMQEREASWEAAED